MFDVDVVYAIDVVNEDVGVSCVVCIAYNG